MKLFLLLILVFFHCSLLHAQKHTYTITSDSTKLTGCDSNELIIENHTQTVPGFLFNTGNGRTIFKRALQRLNDTSWLIGIDTLRITVGNGISYSGDTVELGGTLTKDTKVTILNNQLWLRTPFKAGEGPEKTGQIFIGDSNYIQPWKSTPSGYQHNSSLVISKTKENNNENVELLSMTTADAPGKNGWFLFDYTNQGGFVQPRMETYSNAGASTISSFEHDIIGKANGQVQYLLNFVDYDSLDQSAKYNTTTADFFALSNNYNIGYYVDNNFDVGIGKIPVKGIRLDVSGKASFTDTVAMGARASYNSNLHSSYTQYSLVDKKYTDSLTAVVHYHHSISTPASGTTVSVLNNQYTIINPTGAIASLTVALPSSPSDNDVVLIKFVKAVTAVAYSGGTVADGNAAPAAGTLLTLTFDAATATWY